MKISDCSHYPKNPVKPASDHCQEDNGKFDLRVCLNCGYVGCCEDHPGQHALNHFKETGHPVIASYPADENSFIWCYKDRDYLKKI